MCSATLAEFEGLLGECDANGCKRLLSQIEHERGRLNRIIISNPQELAERNGLLSSYVKQVDEIRAALNNLSRGGRAEESLLDIDDVPNDSLNELLIKLPESYSESNGRVPRNREVSPLKTRLQPHLYRGLPSL